MKSVYTDIWAARILMQRTPMLIPKSNMFFGKYNFTRRVNVTILENLRKLT